MKKILVIAIITLTPFFMNAQPLPPGGGYQHGGGGNQPGGGAPIDGGLSIFLVLGAAYGFRRVYLDKRER